MAGLQSAAFPSWLRDREWCGDRDSNPGPLAGNQRSYHSTITACVPSGNRTLHDPLNRRMLNSPDQLRVHLQALGRNRTGDIRFTKPTFYQLNYESTALPRKDGRGGGIRTLSDSLQRRAFCQLNYTSTNGRGTRIRTEIGGFKVHRPAFERYPCEAGCGDRTRDIQVGSLTFYR